MKRSTTASRPHQQRLLTRGRNLFVALLCLASFGAAAHGYNDRSGIDRYRVDLQFSGGERLSLQSGPGYTYRRYSGYPQHSHYPPAYGKHWNKHGKDTYYKHKYKDDRGHHHKSWSKGHDGYKHPPKRYYTNNWNHQGKNHDRHDGKRFHDGGRH